MISGNSCFHYLLLGGLITGTGHILEKSSHPAWSNDEKTFRNIDGDEWKVRQLWVFLAGSFSACSSIVDGMGASMMSGLLFKYFVFFGMFAGKWIIDRRAEIKVSYVALIKRYPWHTLAGGLFVFVSNSLAVYAMQTELRR